jgi:hypothetical protein
MTRCSRYWAGFLGALLACLSLLGFSPYKSGVYSVPHSGVYVDWYQENAIWAELAHGVSGLSRSVRRADVLILGSSKPLFGVSARILNGRFKDHGLRFFNLGIGGGDGVMGANIIVNRLDLHRKTLLLNLDDNTLSKDTSAHAREALRLDWFQAATRVASVRLKATVDTFLDAVGLPQLRFERNGFVLGPRALPRGYRDAETGDIVSAIRLEYRSPGAYPLPPAHPDAMLQVELLDSPHFREILANWKSRELQVVFITIPYGNGNPAANNYNPALAREAAKRLGADYVDLNWRLVRSADHIHVDRESRRILSERLAEQLAEPSREFVARALRLSRESARAR